MRIASLFLALLVLLPAGASAADTTETLPVYQVELVLFLRDVHPGGEFWPETPGQPDPARAVAVLPVEPGFAPPTLATPLSVADHKLNAEAEALRRKGLTPLLHVAWRQPVGERNNSDWIWLNGGPVSGLVRIGLGRFLHIDSDLVLRDEEAENAPLIRSIDHRRMRSEELHYLDHPAFGILVRIDPVAEPLGPGGTEPRPLSELSD